MPCLRSAKRVSDSTRLLRLAVPPAAVADAYVGVALAQALRKGMGPLRIGCYGF